MCICDKFLDPPQCTVGYMPRILHGVRDAGCWATSFVVRSMNTDERDCSSWTMRASLTSVSLILGIFSMAAWARYHKRSTYSRFRNLTRCCLLVQINPTTAWKG